MSGHSFLIQVIVDIFQFASANIKLANAILKYVQKGRRNQTCVVNVVRFLIPVYGCGGGVHDDNTRNSWKRCDIFFGLPSYITWTEPCVQLSFFSRIFEAIMTSHKMDYRLFILPQSSIPVIDQRCNSGNLAVWWWCLFLRFWEGSGVENSVNRSDY